MSTPSEHVTDDAHRWRLLAVHADAADYYTARLREPAGGPQRRYLIGRGLTNCWSEPRWQVGYAPADWTSLTTHLQHLGYSDQTLTDSGLTIPTRTGGLIDRFRDRITLGIRNPDGDIVAFIARAPPEPDQRCRSTSTAPPPPSTPSTGCCSGSPNNTRASPTGPLR